MKNLSDLAQYRQAGLGDHDGLFVLPYPRTGATLLVIASCAEGWDHVSVSLKHRCPNWYEMEFVKRMFFEDDETAMQLHLPPENHISFAANCLHLWRPLDREIPRPPSYLVGAGKVA